MTTAFVLSGGGNLGAVEAGMLVACEEAGLVPDLLVGTSAGALNGAWIAGGRPATELAEVWRGLHRRDVFPIDPVGGVLALVGLRDHLVSQKGLRTLLREHLAFERLEDAVVPLHVIATDVLTGQDVRLDAGPVVESVLASAAIPGVFAPVTLGGRPLMDGGVVDNTPISHAVELGADRIYVLSTGYACTLPEAPGSALGMAVHAVTIAIEHRLSVDVERYAGQVDLRVVPPLCPLSVAPTDFSQGAELVERGRAHTAAWLAEEGLHRPTPPAEAGARLALHAHS